MSRSYSWLEKERDAPEFQSKRLLETYMCLLNTLFFTPQLSLTPVNHDNMSDSDTQMRDRHMKEESSDEETLAQRYQRLRERGYDNRSHQNTDTPSTPIKQESNDDDAMMAAPVNDQMMQDNGDDAPDRDIQAQHAELESTARSGRTKEKGSKKKSVQPIYNKKKAQEALNEAICKEMYARQDDEVDWKELSAKISTQYPKERDVDYRAAKDRWMRNRVTHAILKDLPVPCEWLREWVSNTHPLPKDAEAKECAKGVKACLADVTCSEIAAAALDGCFDWLDECARALGGGSDVKKRGRRAAQETPTVGGGRMGKGKGKQAARKGQEYMQDEDEDDEEELQVKKKEESGDDEEEAVVNDELDRDQKIVALRKRVAKLEDMVSKMQQQLNQLMASK